MNRYPFQNGFYWPRFLEYFVFALLSLCFVAVSIVSVRQFLYLKKEREILERQKTEFQKQRIVTAESNHAYLLKREYNFLYAQFIAQNLQKETTI
jgi:hypothetical protein